MVAKNYTFFEMNLLQISSLLRNSIIKSQKSRIKGQISIIIKVEKLNVKMSVSKIGGHQRSGGGHLPSSGGHQRSDGGQIVRPTAILAMAEVTPDGHQHQHHANGLPEPEVSSS